MKKLLTYETFVPKKLANRATELKKIEDQKMEHFNSFIQQFQTNLDALQGLQVDDPQEQLFIDLMQGLKPRTDQKDYPWILFLNTVTTGHYMFHYDWWDNIFFGQFDKTVMVFHQKFKMDFPGWKKLMAACLLKYFQFEPFKVKETEGWLYNVKPNTNRISFDQ